MRSECIAAVPQSTCCFYTWKLPVTLQLQPVLFDQAQNTMSRAEAKLRREAYRAEPSVTPWKAYLASREIQNLSSEVADAVFAPVSGGFSSSEPERPSSLTSCAVSRAEGKSKAGLLQEVLPEAGDAPRNNAEKQSPSLALAA